MVHAALTVALNAAVDTTYIIKRLQTGAIHTVQTVNRVAGGKANNVARVLHLLGVNTLATGFAGSHAGAFIKEDLERLGIAADFEWIDGENRTCLVLVDQEGGSLTEIREPGPVISAGEAERFIDRFIRLASGARAVVLSGSLPPGLPPDYYARLIRISRGAGGFVALDGSGEALRQALPAGPDLVKPNREELAAWAGRALSDHADLLDAARLMRSHGARAVAVSLGQDGLLYTGPDGTWQCQPPPVALRNSVGSGDSLVAGILAGRLTGRSIDETLRLGVACGTANAMTDAVASPELADLDRLMPAIKLTRLS